MKITSEIFIEALSLAATKKFRAETYALLVLKTEIKMRIKFR